jgi:predicted dehydrogenase
MRQSVDRRTFLKGTLAGLGVAFLPGGRGLLGYPAAEKLNIGIIGASGRGGSNIGDVSSENIVALCDVDEEYARPSFKQHKKAKKFVDFRKMLDEVGKEIDAVVVSTPDHTHAVAAIAAMKLGKHVYCEKPLTRTVIESRAMRLAAQEHKVVTQMGNQGSASEGCRRAVELAWAGTIGEIKEAHVWFEGGNSPGDRPAEKPAIPAGLDWDLWLGPAPERPFHPTYIRGGWRNWRAFGSGSAGDFFCHTFNIAFRALKLDLLWSRPSGTIRVEAKASDTKPESYPAWASARYEIPARGGLPPIVVTWANGGPKPSADLLRGHPMTGTGCLLSGEKGAIFSGCPWNTWMKLLPEGDFKDFKGPAPSIPRSPGHHAEWIEACKGRGKPFSNFDIGGPMTELAQLANAAALLGQPIVYDPATGKVKSPADADEAIHRKYRAGWSI